MDLAYPSEIVQRLESRWFHVYEVPEQERDLWKSRLRSVVECLFFASLATEEGSFVRIAVVFMPHSPAPVPGNEDEYWTVHSLSTPRSLTIKHVAKLGPVCRDGTSYLVVAPEGSDLVIGAIAHAPERYPWLFRLSKAPIYMRFTAVAPGALVVEEGDKELLSTRAGEILEAPPPFLSGYDNASCDALAQLRVRSGLDPYFQTYLDKILLESLVEAIVYAGGGGLLLIPASEGQIASISPLPYQLQVPINLQKMVVNWSDHGMNTQAAGQNAYMMDWDTSSSLEEIRADRDSDRFNRKFDKIVGWIGRFSNVDGAIVMTQDLQILGFGARVSATGECPEEVHVVTGRNPEKWRTLHLNTRGTRHRAAVSFAAQDPSNLAFIVSHDGDAAAVTHVDGRLVYWPLRIKPRWSGAGIHDWP